MSECPCSPVGRMMVRLGKAVSGTAQAPGAMTWPSVRATVGGRPRMRMKLLAAIASRSDLDYEPRIGGWLGLRHRGDTDHHALWLLRLGIALDPAAALETMIVSKAA